MSRNLLSLLFCFVFCFNVFSEPIIKSAGGGLTIFLHTEWRKFKDTHRKSYSNVWEELEHLRAFIARWHIIERHNQRFKDGKESFHMVVNKFADRLRHEKSSCILHSEPNESLTSNISNSTYVKHWESSGLTFLQPANVKLPEAVDWRDEGAVSEVKSQEACGACYAFSAAGALEGQHFRRTGKLISMSEQNIIDCSKLWGNLGCDGGFMPRAFAYVQDNDGIDSEESYPYQAKEAKCSYSVANRATTSRGFFVLPSGDEEALKSAVATMGPISTGINAASDSFELYSGGIYDVPECSALNLTHAVLVVGYGVSNGTDYWIIKNSWGPEWGEEGFMRIIRNKKNFCGIARAASYPMTEGVTHRV